MSSLTENAQNTYRAFHVAGLPASEANEPEKLEIIELFAQIDGILSAIGIGGSVGVIKATQALLYADLAHAANVVALVYADPNADLDDFYVKIGSSGSGSWAKLGLTMPLQLVGDIARMGDILDEALAQTAADKAATAASAAAANASKIASAASAGQAGTARDQAIAAEDGIEAYIAGLEANPAGTLITSALGRDIANAANPAVARSLINSRPNRWLNAPDVPFGDAITYPISQSIAGTPVAISVNCFGDSTMEGYQAGGPATLPNSGGAGASITPPQALANALNHTYQYSEGITASIIVTNCAYSGDTTKMAYTRWASQPAAAFSFLSFGYNDAAGVSGATPLEARQYLSLWLTRLIGQGSVPIVCLQASRLDPNQNALLKAIRDTQRQVCEEFGVLTIDLEEQIGWMPDRWDDGLHFRTPAYNEMGAHLAAVLTEKQGRSCKRITAGTVLQAYDDIGEGGSDPAIVTGSVWTRHVEQGHSLTIAGYFEQDVYPILTFYNTTPGHDQQIVLTYAEGQSGEIDVVFAGNDGSGAATRDYVGGRLRRGWRQIVLAPVTSYDFDIVRIEFRSADSFPFAFGGWQSTGRTTTGDFSGYAAISAPKSVNQGNWFNAATGVATIPDDGIYDFGATVVSEQTSAGDVSVAIKRNGTIYGPDISRFSDAHGIISAAIIGQRYSKGEQVKLCCTINANAANMYVIFSGSRR